MFDRLWFGLCLWRLVGEFEMCFYMFVFSKCNLELMFSTVVCVLQVCLLIQMQ